jgi:cytochrome c-type protein NapB
MRTRRLLGLALAALVGSCHRPAPEPVAAPAPSQVRARRRAYDGAPPVIPHKRLGGACATCHATAPREVPGVGLAPPNPHLHTPGMSAASRCEQCHVFATPGIPFADNSFRGLAQDLRRGERLYPRAPPVLPHPVFMREDCAACHDGPAARPEVRCTHPDRINCLQCHARPAPTLSERDE